MEQLQKKTGQTPIVLIVDDNPSIRNVVAWSLQFGGFQPIEAVNGLEAVKWMEQAAGEQRFPAVILLDLAMPGMDGNAFLAWLQSSWTGRYPTPSVIVVTAANVAPRSLTFPPPVKQIITKPFHVRDLLEVIRQYSG